MMGKRGRAASDLALWIGADVVDGDVGAAALLLVGQSDPEEPVGQEIEQPAGSQRIKDNDGRPGELADEADAAQAA